MAEVNVENVPNHPYNELQFEEFLKTLKKGTAGHWYEIAKALGVSTRTLERWRKHPKAIEARNKGIQESLASMKSSGKKDWHMWKSKLALMDVVETEKAEIDLTSGGKIIGGFRQKIHKDE